ncbi:bifunctional aldolase/short-chain dehydrogenase [Rhodobacteraceae bacterium Araon29]
MQSSWNQSDLSAFISASEKQGLAKDLAIRIYSTRLLGQEPELVLHGGGNTSLKTHLKDPLGDLFEVLCVKGSGWDMASIEAPGLPAVELAPLAALAERSALSDQDLVAAQRKLLLQPSAPNPSIEAVLHAIIPHKYVDHSHANAIISLTNQPNGEDLIRDLFPDTMIIPYVMPGFALAKLCHNKLKENPKTKHMILLQHGIFTFHDDPRQSYEDMISMCSQAEDTLQKGCERPFKAAKLPPIKPEVSDIAPIIRGALATKTNIEGRPNRWVLDFRHSDEIRHFTDGQGLCDYATRGNATPDHVIRIKRFGLVLPAPSADTLDQFKVEVVRAVERFAQEYKAYFDRNSQQAGGGFKILDCVPRVVYVPGIGVFGVGKTAKSAAISADIAEATISVITKAEGIGTFAALSEKELFDIEYWSLEQAKLASVKEQKLDRHIVFITGAASGLGFETAKLFKENGAEVVLFDVDQNAVQAAASEIGGIPIHCDVTDPTAVVKAVDKATRKFGGVDILISNAGAAFQGALKTVDDKLFQKAFDLNFWSHHLMARACVAIMEKQDTGGALVFNVSKQALNPGRNFGPYGTSKAALMALMRQYAVEFGDAGISSNAVNADRIRTNLLTDGFIKDRAKARGTSTKEYMRGNLLGREVTGRDVAEAFFYLATTRTTSGAVLTVDGGNVSAMVR